MWPNLLSLDAPFVAVLWQALFIWTYRARFDLLITTLLFVAVWTIYVADRVMDAWRDSNFEARHEFYRRNWKRIAPVWIAVTGAGAWLAWTQLSRALFVRGVALLFVIGIYFAITHSMRRRWPKELAVAILFAIGSTLAAWPEAQSRIDFAAFAVFGLLCWINCASIEKWESRGLQSWPVRELSIIAGLVALIFLYADRPIVAGAETASAFAFVILDRARLSLSRNTLRVLADVALLTPILFLPVIMMRP